MHWDYSYLVQRLHSCRNTHELLSSEASLKMIKQNKKKAFPSRSLLHILILLLMLHTFLRLCSHIVRRRTRHPFWNWFHDLHSPPTQLNQRQTRRCSWCEKCRWDILPCAISKCAIWWRVWKGSSRNGGWAPSRHCWRHWWSRKPGNPSIENSLNQMVVQAAES